MASIPPGLELPFRDAWAAELEAVIECPTEEQRWVRLLLFWICTASAFRPTCAANRRSSCRSLCERRQLCHFLQVWREPFGIFRLVSYLRDLPGPSPRRSAVSGARPRRSQRLARLGRFRDAVSALSPSTPVNPTLLFIEQNYTCFITNKQFNDLWKKC